MMGSLDSSIVPLLFGAIWSCIGARIDPKPPNIVLFLADDMGWGDLSCYGHPTQEPGSIDTLARDGVRFTQAYAASVACTPSRAALLTGRLPLRTGVFGDFLVFLPDSQSGLPRAEVTIAEALKDAGYVTGMVGKWHLGINEFRHNDGRHLPYNHGFDHVGTILPFSLEYKSCAENENISMRKKQRCMLYHNSTIIQQPVRLEDLTDRLLWDAKAFLHQNADRPFFFYYSFPQTHTPLFNKPGMAGSSRRGVYGDQMNEMSWAVGEVLATLDDLGLTEDTLVVFSSDHGPQLEACYYGGSAGGLSGSKLNYMEGGLRVPLIMRWPGKLEPGRVILEPVSLMDLLPTFVQLSGSSKPPERHLDGRSLQDILLSADSDSDDNPRGTPHHEVLLWYCDTHLVAARYGPYKIHYRWFPPVDEKDIRSICRGGIPFIDLNKHTSCVKGLVLETPRIHHLERDPAELHPLPPEEFGDLLATVANLASANMATIEKRPPVLNQTQGHPSLLPCCNPPYCTCNYKPSTYIVL